MEEFTPRPCDRCNCGGSATYELEGQQQPLCYEFQLGYGIISWLCFDCRRTWIKVMEASKLSDLYQEKAFELEFWKSRVGESTPAAELSTGLGLYRELCELEKRVKNFATGWLEAGADNRNS